MKIRVHRGLRCLEVRESGADGALESALPAIAHDFFMCD